LCVDPGASWSVVPLAVTLASLEFGSEGMNGDVDIGTVVRQSSTAAAAQFSTERGTSPDGIGDGDGLSVGLVAEPQPQRSARMAVAAVID